MGDLLTAKLVNQKKETQDGSVLKDKVIAIYFSAHWCPPCRGFTPILKKFYEDLKAAGKPFEVVFVSSDRSESDMMSYFCNDHGDYYALPFGSELIAQLKSKYQVTGIPYLVFVKQNGDVATANGRGEVQSGADNAVETFKKLEEMCK